MVGYCFPTMALVRGRLTFTRCDGRKSTCVTRHGYSARMEEGNRCRDCPEWCQTFTEAVLVGNDYLKDLDMDEYDPMFRDVMKVLKDDLARRVANLEHRGDRLPCQKVV